MLQREKLIKSIIATITQLGTNINLRGSINLYDSHILAEDFIAKLLNMVFDYQLENLNYSQKNQPSIDLGDKANGIAFQVTTEKSSKKIQGTIDKFVEQKLYNEYVELYFFVLQERYSPHSEFNTKGKFTFDNKTNILDLRSLTKKINSLETEKLRRIDKFLTREVYPSIIAMRPEILIGVHRTDIPSRIIQEWKVLPQTTTIKIDEFSGFSSFYLLIKNQGDSVAKFIKIQMEIGYANSTNLPKDIRVSEIPPWKKQGNNNFSFSGGSEWVLYPYDSANFQFFVDMELGVSRQLSIHCTTWAEGFNNPVTTELEVWPEWS
jgi:hypothetical protein